MIPLDEVELPKMDSRGRLHTFVKDFGVVSTLAVAYVGRCELSTKLRYFGDVRCAHR